MNKNRRNISSQVRKKMEKEVHKGQKKLSKEPVERTDTLTPKKALKKYPAKQKKEEKPLMDAVVKEMQIKKKKKTTKHSKRTKPGEVDHRESPPASIHPESTRWEKTLVKQNKTHRKELTKKIEKRNSKRSR